MIQYHYNNSDRFTLKKILNVLFEKYYLSLLLTTALAVFIVLSFSDYLLFHSFVEIFSIVLFFNVASVVWIAKKYLTNAFVLIVGIAAFLYAVLDIFHLLSYKGMPLSGGATDTATSFWVAGRYFQAVSFLVGALLLTKVRRIPIRLVFSVAAALVVFLSFDIFNSLPFSLLPTSYIEGEGLTAFKIVSEFAFIAAGLVSLFFIYKKRKEFQKRAFISIFVAISAFVISEIFFCLYFDVTSITNMFGHVFRAVSAYMLFRGISLEIIENPFENLFDKLNEKKNELNNIYNSSIPICVTDLNFNIISANESYSNYFQSDHKTIIGEKCYNTRSCANCFTANCSMKKVVNGTERMDIETQRISSHGERRYCITHVRPFYNNEGELKGIVETYTDITARKIAESALAESEKKFKNTFENAAAGIVHTSTESNIMSVNERFAYMLDYPKTDIVGKSMLDFTHPEDAVESKKLIDSLIEGDISTAVFEIRLLKKDNEVVWVHFTSALSLNDAQEVEYIINVIENIDERKRAQEKMRLELEMQRSSIEKAQTLQKRLNTYKMPESSKADIRAYYKPSELLSGDYLEIKKTKRGNIAVILADCTGHGLEASLYATLLHSVSDNYLNVLITHESPVVFLDMVNKKLCKLLPEGQYPTMFVGIIDPGKQMLSYSNAMSELPIIFRNGDLIKAQSVEGFHLAFDDKIKYSSNDLRLHNNDIILFFSDALIEIQDTKGFPVGQYEVERRLSQVKKDDTQSLDSFINKIETLMSKSVLADDLTMIAVRINEPFEKNMLITKYEELEILRDELEEALLRFGYNSIHCKEISVVLEELGKNALVHGRKKESDAVEIVVMIDCVECKLYIRDNGSGFDPADVKDPEDIDYLMHVIEHGGKELIGGRGVWLAQLYADSISYNKVGNAVTAVCRRQAQNTIFRF